MDSDPSKATLIEPLSNPDDTRMFAMLKAIKAAKVAIKTVDFRINLPPLLNIEFAYPLPGALPFMKNESIHTNKIQNSDRERT